MNKCILIFVIFCLTAVNALAADFAGTWKGQGYVITDYGKWSNLVNQEP